MQIIIIQNFITGINRRQEKSEKFQLNCEQQKIALLPIIDSCLPNNTLERATERTTLDFDLRQDKIKRADLLQTSRETGNDSLSSGRRLQCVPEGKHKTRRTALRHATANSSIDLLLSNQSSQPYILLQ